MTTATASRAVPRPRDVLGAFGIYVHVPFCAHRCWYCDFNAYSGLDEAIPAYMDALVRDARDALSAPADADLSDRPPVTSVFIGGGTPSLVDPAWIGRLMDAIRGAWDLAAGAEVTIECNPESADGHKLAAYLDAGVNRISFGVQSLDDASLASLGRLHDAEKAVAALRLAQGAGFREINADLIFGIPGEDDATWRHSIDGVLACGPTHVSCYALTYEEGTPLHSWRRIGKVRPVPDDDVAARWEIADDALAHAGFDRYEVSNWARPGSSCRHNSLYWAVGEYLGIGAGAHSHLASSEGSVRSWTAKSPDRYAQDVSTGRCPMAGREDIDAQARASEVMFCGLRTTEGVSADGFRAIAGRDLERAFGTELTRAADDGLLDWDGARAVPTRRGTLLGDDVVGRFL